MALKKSQVWSKLVWGGVSAGHVFFTFVLEAFWTLPFRSRFWHVFNHLFFTFFSGLATARAGVFHVFFHVFPRKT